jgi:hypothetical protein
LGRRSAAIFKLDHYRAGMAVGRLAGTCYTRSFVVSPRSTL